MAEAGGGGGGRTDAVKPSPATHSTDVLPQRKKLPVCPMRLAIGGFAATVVLGYFVLYSKKKPEASAMDVARVAAGDPRK